MSNSLSTNGMTAFSDPILKSDVFICSLNFVPDCFLHLAVMLCVLFVYLWWERLVFRPHNVDESCTTACSPFHILTQSLRLKHQYEKMYTADLSGWGHNHYHFVSV